MIDLTKTYRTRDGETVTDLRLRQGYHASDMYPLTAAVDGSYGFTFTASGSYLIEEIHDLDLIAVEEPTPAPAAPVQYRVLPLGVAPGFDTLEEAESRAKECVAAGRTIGIFKMIGTVAIPATPAPTVTYAA